ncbi:hypothetical protein OEG79_10455 [Pseudomonas sp. Z8(2022)]|jgi:hypothetical protein|uniref:hypothetical protein n=1 Tax=Pseudomonadaceae TaxID=135621 RepID=UPI0021F4B82D|nr:MULTISPECIES: hypothetical protein [Pseudomonas]UYP32479.1 hypothetical protein OEG79_10455 [Pseudomonas sp. Z8(2022)]
MKEHTDNNLHDWQRYASLGSGLALIGAGLRRGGLLGLAGAALGGCLLARGLGEHHEFKRARLADPLGPGAEKARYAHMPLDSEVHSPDFATQGTLPDTTPMGHERSGP